jgi:DNA-binding CsgD family transcriptional regulator
VDVVGKSTHFPSIYDGKNLDVSEEINWYYLQNLPNISPIGFYTLQCIAQGMTYAEIAELRYVYENVPKRTIYRIRDRVGASTIPHLIHLAHEAGIL